VLEEALTSEHTTFTITFFVRNKLYWKWKF